jgi:hypothetical protein
MLWQIQQENSPDHGGLRREKNFKINERKSRGLSSCIAGARRILLFTVF